MSFKNLRESLIMSSKITTTKKKQGDMKKNKHESELERFGERECKSH